MIKNHEFGLAFEQSIGLATQAKKLELCLMSHEAKVDEVILTSSAPGVGSEIYVPSSDNHIGGKAIVKSVLTRMSGGGPAVFLVVREHPGAEYSWDFLEQEQDKLIKLYGNQQARPDRGGLDLWG